MASILEALQAAQERNRERDVMNAQRQMPILPIIDTSTIKPIVLDTGGDGGDNNFVQDTRTPEQKYRDAVRINNSFVVGLPVIGTGIGLMNDYYIQEYEKENPNDIVAGQRYSTLGRILGFGDEGTTGIGGVFGNNSDLWNQGMFPMDGDSNNAATGNVGYRGDAHRAESGGGMGPSASGPSVSDSFSGGRDDDGWGE